MCVSPWRQMRRKVCLPYSDGVRRPLFRGWVPLVVKSRKIAETNVLHKTYCMEIL